jgi:hypothetical protein
MDTSEYPMLADLRRQASCLKTLAGRYREFSSLGFDRHTTLQPADLMKRWNRVKIQLNPKTPNMPISLD